MDAVAMLTTAKKHLDAGRYDMAYVLANEVLDVDPTQPVATQIRQRALYRLIPTKRLFDKSAQLLVEGKKRLKDAKAAGFDADHRAIIKLLLEAKKWHSSLGVLMALAEAYDALGEYATAYVYASEALAMSTGVNVPNLRGVQLRCLGSVPLFPKLDSLPHLSAYVMVEECFPTRRDQVSPYYRESNWPSGRELGNLFVSQEDLCHMKWSDGKEVVPRVKFNQLAQFLANNVGGTIDEVFFNSDESADSELPILRMLRTVPVECFQLTTRTTFSACFKHLTASEISFVLNKVVRAHWLCFMGLRLPHDMTTGDFLRLTAVQECTELLLTAIISGRGLAEFVVDGEAPPSFETQPLVDYIQRSPSGHFVTIPDFYLQDGAPTLIKALRKDFAKATRQAKYKLVIHCYMTDANELIGEQEKDGIFRNKSKELMRLSVFTDQKEVLLGWGHHFQSIEIVRSDE